MLLLQNFKQPLLTITAYYKRGVLKLQKMKKGLIKISNELYVNDWQRLHIFMKDFRPIHIEFRHWENDIWYMYGISELFDELKEGDAVPQYDVIFTQHQNKDITYEFKRV